MNIPAPQEESVNKVFIFGNADSGKTTAAGIIEEVLSQKVKVELIKDRTEIEELVEAECQNIAPDAEGWKMGLHSKYYRADDGLIVMRALDGTWWNLAHKQMFKNAARFTPDRKLLVLEYAIAPNHIYDTESGKPTPEPLRQSGEQALKWAVKAHALDGAYILELDSNRQIRGDREGLRIRDKMDRATFEFYFDDGGKLPFDAVKALLGDRFYQMDNNFDSTPKFQAEIHRIAEQLIAPTIFGEGSSFAHDRMRRR